MLIFSDLSSHPTCFSTNRSLSISIARCIDFDYLCSLSCCSQSFRRLQSEAAATHSRHLRSLTGSVTSWACVMSMCGCRLKFCFEWYRARGCWCWYRLVRDAIPSSSSRRLHRHVTKAAIGSHRSVIHPPYTHAMPFGTDLPHQRRTFLNYSILSSDVYICNSPEHSLHALLRLCIY